MIDQPESVISAQGDKATRPAGIGIPPLRMAIKVAKASPPPAPSPASTIDSAGKPLAMRKWASSNASRQLPRKRKYRGRRDHIAKTFAHPAPPRLGVQAHIEY